MITFGRPKFERFASASLRAHLLRGGAAALLTTVSVVYRDSHPLAALAFGLGALVPLRGCPACWTIGLLHTLRISKASCSLVGSGDARTLRARRGYLAPSADPR